MKTDTIFFLAVNSFLDKRIHTKYKNIRYTSEEKEPVYLIDIIDENSERIKLTFVFWKDSTRVTILIEDYEIVDEEFKSTDNLIENINCLISGEIIKTEKYKGGKIIYRQYQYYMLIDGEKEFIKDERKMSFSWFSKPEIKVTCFAPW